MSEKRVIFNMPEKTYADFRIRLRHDGLKQYQFFNWVVEKYLTHDVDMLNTVGSLKSLIAAQGKAKIRKTRKLLDEGNDMQRNFNLNKDEVSDLYDIIEGDLPEV